MGLSNFKAISLLGGNTHTTNCNLTIDFKDGIYTDNSSGNILDCNVLESEINDIHVNTNSPIQMIQGNTFSNAETNLNITSSIGQQVHHGNVWHSNSNLGAFLLQGLPFTSSQFFVDFHKSDTELKNWYPKTSTGTVSSDPQNLFFNDVTTKTYQCGGCSYGLGNFLGWFNSSPSPEAICNWLKLANIRLKPSQVKWWRTYIYRLIKKSGRSYESLSSCLKTIVDAVNTTKQKNIETINDKLTALSSLNQVATSNTYSHISSLVADATAGQPFDQSSYNADISSLRASIAGNATAEAALFNDISTELSYLTSDAAYSDEELIYTTLLDYLQYNTLPSNNILKLIAEGCSDERGENVFLAKDLISLIGQVNPLGQLCEEAAQRSALSIEQAPLEQYIIAKVYPTVTSGIITIELAGENSYNIDVVSVLGNKVKQLSLQTGTIKIDMSPYRKGIYMIRIRDMQNEKVTYNTKIIISE